jgi:hypothetical protein
MIKSTLNFYPPVTVCRDEASGEDGRDKLFLKIYSQFVIN